MVLRSLLVLGVVFLVSCSETKPAVEDTMPEKTSALDLTDDSQRFSYMLGAVSAKSIENNFSNLDGTGVTLDNALMLQGFGDGLSGDSQVADEDLQATLQEFQGRLREVQQQQAQQAAAKNAKLGQEFLAANKQKAGVITLDSGLQYEVLVKGDGASPASSASTVKVHYKGTLIDGKQFDSSYDRGEPATFPLNRVIPGWTEGVQLMEEGAKWRFVIPSDLGYGLRGSPPNIPGNSTLIFEVELLEVIE